MDESMPIEKAVAIPTFVGSILSFVATTAAIILHIVFPPRRHFRHALVINLLVADCLNSLNNSISGGVFLHRGITGTSETPASPSCIANAYIGQFTVQTIDFTILVISLSVLFTVLDVRTFRSPSLVTLLLVCGATWVPGLITTNVGLGLGIYGHVSGNWCWISPRYLGLRYALTHGWRIAIFIATIGIYTFIYLRLKQVFNRTRISNKLSLQNTTDRPQGIGAVSKNADDRKRSGTRPPARSHQLQEELRHVSVSKSSPPKGKTFNSSPTDLSNEDSSSTLGLTEMQRHCGSPPSEHAPNRTTTHSFSIRPTPPPNLKRMLMLNGYPIAYIILWIPGIANRFVESKDASPLWLRALQCSTQYIGLANALTYGFNEQMRQKAWERWNRWGIVRRST